MNLYNTHYLIRLFIIILFIQLCPSVSYSKISLSQSKNASSLTRQVLGINLHPQSSRLLKEVENLYGKQVCVKLMQDIGGCSELTMKPDNAIPGNSQVSRDGTPTILLNASYQTEEFLVHELLHLKYMAQGFPELNALILCRENEKDKYDTKINELLIDSITHLIRDTIQHWRFNPEMKKMGFKPGEDFLPDLKSSIHRGNYKNLTPEYEWLFVPLFYFKACLELDNHKLLIEIREWYKRKHWGNYIKIGDDLVRVVESTNPNTPRKEYETFLQCANLLCQGRMKYEADEWRTQNKGNFTQHIARYKIYVFRSLNQ